MFVLSSQPPAEPSQPPAHRYIRRTSEFKDNLSLQPTLVRHFLLSRLSSPLLSLLKMPRRAINNLARKLLPAVLLASILATVQSAPVGTPTSAAPSPTPTVPYASDDPNTELWGPYSDIVPQPQRGPYGAPILGPQNIPLALQNPSLLAPPTTDHGTV